jgi:SAM-dependent methyltransferase
MTDSDSYDNLYSNNPYVGRQHTEENASTAALCQLMSETISPVEEISLLDAGCGDGAVINSLLRRFPSAKVSGFDCSVKMLDFARRSLPESVRLGLGDLENIGDFSSEVYDVVISIHTLSLFDSFEVVLNELMKRAKRHVYVNSLFSSHDVDVKSTVYEPGIPPVSWNTWSIGRVTEFVKMLGGHNVEFRPLFMPYELSYQEKGTGSYTQKLADGRLLTFTGPVALPWYLLRIDMT